MIDCGQLTDVTRAAQASWPGRAEPRLAAILRFLPVVVFSLDSEGLITSVSEVGVDILDASSADVVAAVFLSFFRAPVSADRSVARWPATR
jgi:PAS domain-containing protein